MSGSFHRTHLILMQLKLVEAIKEDVNELINLFDCRPEKKKKKKHSLFDIFFLSFSFGLLIGWTVANFYAIVKMNIEKKPSKASESLQISALSYNRFM